MIQNQWLRLPPWARDASLLAFVVALCAVTTHVVLRGLDALLWVWLVGN